VPTPLCTTFPYCLDAEVFDPPNTIILVSTNLKDPEIVALGQDCNGSTIDFHQHGIISERKPSLPERKTRVAPIDCSQKLYKFDGSVLLCLSSSDIFGSVSTTTFVHSIPRVSC
jgi:hypothetical protein